MQLVLYAAILALGSAIPLKPAEGDGGTLPKEVVHVETPELVQTPERDEEHADDHKEDEKRERLFKKAKKHYPAILRDDRVLQEDGSFSFDFETEDGIVRSQFGGPLPHANNAIGQYGSYSYPLPNGEIFTLKFVADENGFRPESPFLPVAPAFPHPIPQFVIDQIEFARHQREEEARRLLEEAEELEKLEEAKKEANVVDS